MAEYKIDSGIPIPESDPGPEIEGEEDQVNEPETAQEKPTSLTEKLLNQAHYGTRSAWQWVRSVRERVDLPELDEAMRLIVIARGKIEEKQRYLASHPEPEPTESENVVGSQGSLATVGEVSTTLQEEGSHEAEPMDSHSVDKGQAEGEACGLGYIPQSPDASELDPKPHNPGE